VSSTRYGTNINVYSQISPPAGTWYGVTYGNGIFVAVGYNVGMTSPDGIIWTTQPVPSAAWFSVIYGNGLFVAVGYGEGTTTNIMTSPDGINWTIQTSPGTNAIWNSVTYGNGIFVATSIYGPPYVITSPDGINWTTQTVPSQQLGPCTYGNGLFVICAYNPFGNYNVMTSPDGITWTPHVGISSRWRSVTYGNGVYVATGELPPVAMASHDGINWKAIYTIPFSFWDSIAYGNGRFVSVSNGQENFSTQNTYVTTSTDGFQFSFLLTGSPVYGNNIWVGISKGGVFGPATTFTYLVYSYDGRYWYVGSAPPDTWSAVSYGNGFFMAVTNNGTYPVAYSQDGINWSTETTGFQTTDWNSIVFGQNTFMALEAEGASTMITQVTETF